MKNEKAMTASPQETVAYAWAVLDSEFSRLGYISERLLERCRYATSNLSDAEAYDLLADVPAIKVN